MLPSSALGRGMKRVKAVGTRGLVIGACCLVVGLALQACRDEEQGRILYFEKGTYLGKADQPLTEDQLRALRQRTSNQQM
jgi:hypothetical protein